MCLWGWQRLSSYLGPSITTLEHSLSAAGTWTALVRQSTSWLWKVYVKIILFRYVISSISTPIIQTLSSTWRFTFSCSVCSHTLRCATWKGAMSHSSSTPSYSGQPAKRSFREATTTDCCCSGSSCTGCLCKSTPFLRNLCSICVWTNSTYHIWNFWWIIWQACYIILSLEYMERAFFIEVKLVPSYYVWKPFETMISVVLDSCCN